MFHRRRSMGRLGAPEVVGVVLLTLVAAALFVWSRVTFFSNWRETTGYVTQGEVVPPYDRMDPGEPEVRLTYRYEVEGTGYEGRYEGFWPEAGGPNALHGKRVEGLTQPGHGLQVHYDGGHPERSRLLHPGHAAEATYLVLAGALLAVSVGYWLLAYPQLRRR